MSITRTAENALRTALITGCDLEIKITRSESGMYSMSYGAHEPSIRGSYTIAGALEWLAAEMKKL